MASNPEIKKIEKLVRGLSDSGFLQLFANNCVSAADVVQNMLYDAGVQSEIVECTVTLSGQYPDGNQAFFFLGYDKLQDSNEIDTHVVTITKDSTPVLIDMSISHLLPNGVGFICNPVNSLDPKIISEYEFGGLKVTYRIKESVRLPSLHRKSLLERVGEYAKTTEKINALKILVFVSIGMGAVNLLLNLISLALRAVR